MICEAEKHDKLQAVLQEVAFGLSASSSQAFFDLLVTHLARTFDTDYAYVGVFERHSQNKMVETVAAFAHGKLTDNFRYSLINTPCDNVVGKHVCAYPNNIQEAFPLDELLADMNIDSYIGAPLFDTGGEALGIIVVLDSGPIADIEFKSELLKIYTLRAARELERMRADTVLHENEQRFRSLVSNIPGVIYRCTMGKNDAMDFISDEIVTLTGYDTGQFTGGRGRSFPGIIHADDVHFVQETIEAAVKRREPYMLEYRIIDVHGDIRWVYEKGQAHFDHNGVDLWHDGAIFDITERKQAERELQDYRSRLEDLVEQRTAELKRANRELEAFAYSVSHDLRAPLRAIHGFSDALREDYIGTLDSTAEDYLQRICAASQRMSDLIDDLLRLSKIGRREMLQQRIDLSAIARDVAAGFQRQEPRESVDLDIQPDLYAEGDEHLLRIALENLFSNAWKYTRDTARPHIEFGAANTAGQVSFYLRDNGAGFDMRYADKLFGVFERLHGMEFEGTGIGLATVKRIIDRHNGRIWGESQPGKGACFHFTLPTDPRHGPPDSACVKY